MDLRQFTQTPTFESQQAANPQAQQQQQQQQQQQNRRPSISSMSSASGYASSTYGGGSTSVNAIHPNTTGNSLLSSRVTQSRHFGNNTATATPNSGSNNMLNNQNLLFNSTWLPQQSNSTTNTSILNVTPWIEQQLQVSPLVNSTGPSSGNVINIQSLSMSSLSPTENGNFNLSSPAPLKLNPATEESTGKDDSKNEQEAAGGESGTSPSPDSKTTPSNNNANTTTSTTNDDDDLIPTAIVIKNIPFAIKKEQLLEVMTKLSLPLPYAFNYHFDNGVFRGLAFANFTSTDETTLVVNQLNGREIGGRKLRVEYKKMLPVQERERIEREKREKRGQLEEQHRSGSATSLASMYSVASAPLGAAVKLPGSMMVGPGQQQQQLPQGSGSNGAGAGQNAAPERLYSNLMGIAPPWNLDFNDPDTLELYSQLLLFKEDKEKAHSELLYPATLTPNQRKLIPILLNFLKLVESYENGLIILKRRPGANVHNSPNPGLPLHNPLFRSQSQNSLAVLQLTQTLQNPRYRNSLQNSSPQQLMKTNFMNKSSSNLASLRNPAPQAGAQLNQQQQAPNQPQPSQQQNGFMSQQPLVYPPPPPQSVPISQQQQQYNSFQQLQHPQLQFRTQQLPPQNLQPHHNHHLQGQQPQQFSHNSGLLDQQSKSYLDESLIASVENLTFN